MEKSSLTGFDDLLTCRVLRSPLATWSRESHCDVIMNGHIKQDCALGDYSDLLPRPIRVEILDILVIQGDCTPLHVVHAEQELSNGGFSRTRAADNKSGFESRDVDSDVVKDRNGRA